MRVQLGEEQDFPKAEDGDNKEETLFYDNAYNV